MHLEHIPKNLEKRRECDGLQATLNPAATEAAISDAEGRNGLAFPDQVRAFYGAYNGLRVVDPPFEVLPVESLSRSDDALIHFATADDRNRICFDCSGLNDAGQWDIVCGATGRRITVTMASFWSNKMWKWIDRRLAFWSGEC